MTEQLQTPSRRWGFWEMPGPASGWPSPGRGEKSTAEVHDEGGSSRKGRSPQEFVGLKSGDFIFLSSAYLRTSARGPLRLQPGLPQTLIRKWIGPIRVQILMTSQVAGLFFFSSFSSPPGKLSQFAQVRSPVKSVRLVLSTHAGCFQRREEKSLCACS